jgi:hypothetical protein
MDIHRSSRSPLLLFFLFSKAPKPVVEPTQTPIQWVMESLYRGVKRPGRESDLVGAEVRSRGSYASNPPIMPSLPVQEQMYNYFHVNMAPPIRQSLAEQHHSVTRSAIIFLSSR